MDPRVQMAYDTIKRRFADKLLLADLAREAGLSPYFFQRLFKKELKETPAACLHRIRLERAAHLMKIDPGLTVAKIALDCGFSSLSAFSRAFSNWYGRSPVEFAKRKTDYSFLQRAQEQLTVEVVYHPRAIVIYKHTSFYSAALMQNFPAVQSFCELKGIPVLEKRIGILTHISFHGPKDQLNYYAGVEVREESGKLPANRLFIIPEGKYACFSTRSSYDQFTELMVQFKLEWLDKSPYQIREIFAFEEIAPGSMAGEYPFISRKVYVPLKNKYI